MKKTVLALAIAAAAPAALAAPPTTDEMWRIIQEQQREIERLKSDQQQTDAKVEATADAVERGAVGGGKLAEWASRTTLGGYGEHHFNHFKDGDDQIDAHRFVLFIGHQYSDTISFHSELELEHSLAGEGKPGEVELEQAFIKWNYVGNQYLDMGLFLIPVGILNETHEPDTFFGVERNPVESNIIPTTWWETGVMAGGEILPGLTYNVGVHSGMKTPVTGANTLKIRNGRQKSANATAEDLAATARLKYTGIRGLELAATVQRQQDMTQGALPGEDAEGTLWEAHARYSIVGLTLTALAAEWDIDGATAKAIGRDKQEGWYGEASYKFTPKFGVFARYSEWDNNAGETTVSGDTEIEQIDYGIAYWLHPRVVIKADYTEQDSKISDADAFNLGLGWSF